MESLPVALFEEPYRTLRLRFKGTGTLRNHYPRLRVLYPDMDVRNNMGRYIQGSSLQLNEAGCACTDPVDDVSTPGATKPRIDLSGVRSPLERGQFTGAT